MDMQGQRRGGRPKRSWMDIIKDDSRRNGLSGSICQRCPEATNRKHRPHIKVENKFGDSRVWEST